MAPVPGGLVCYGGSNRSGELYQDSTLFTGPDGQPTPLEYAVKGGGVAGMPPGLGGHASATLLLNGTPSVLHFGGINFVDEVAVAGLYEVKGGVWREVVGCEGVDAPSGRTGHTLSAVPYPRVVAAGEEGVGGPASGGCGVGDTRPLKEVLGGNPEEAVGVLFGGSSPSEGPLNDLFILHCTEGGPAKGGLGERGYRWEAPPTTGPCPPSRELHAAFVRPAIVQALAPSPFPLTGDTLVRVLAPPALCIHGGRSEDGAPRNDLCVLDLHGLQWLPPVKTPHSLCASGSAPSPGGFQLVQFGGLRGGAAGLSNALLVLDTWGERGGSLVEAPPATWKWTTPPLVATPPPTPRFASAAGCVAGEDGGYRVCVWGGMTAGEDLSEALWIQVPPVEAGEEGGGGGESSPKQ
jgi:hypothetical protein